MIAVIMVMLVLVLASQVVIAPEYNVGDYHYSTTGTNVNGWLYQVQFLDSSNNPTGQYAWVNNEQISNPPHFYTTDGYAIAIHDGGWKYKDITTASYGENYWDDPNPAAQNNQASIWTQTQSQTTGDNFPNPITPGGPDLGQWGDLNIEQGADGKYYVIKDGKTYYSDESGAEFNPTSIQIGAITYTITGTNSDGTYNLESDGKEYTWKATDTALPVEVVLTDQQIQDQLVADLIKQNTDNANNPNRITIDIDGTVYDVVTDDDGNSYIVGPDGTWVQKVKVVDGKVVTDGNQLTEGSDLSGSQGTAGTLPGAMTAAQRLVNGLNDAANIVGVYETEIGNFVFDVMKVGDKYYIVDRETGVFEEVTYENGEVGTIDTPDKVVGQSSDLEQSEEENEEDTAEEKALRDARFEVERQQTIARYQEIAARWTTIDPDAYLVTDLFDLPLDFLDASTLFNIDPDSWFYKLGMQGIEHALCTMMMPNIEGQSDILLPDYSSSTPYDVSGLPHYGHPTISVKGKRLEYVDRATDHGLVNYKAASGDDFKCSDSICYPFASKRVTWFPIESADPFVDPIPKGYLYQFEFYVPHRFSGAEIEEMDVGQRLGYGLEENGSILYSIRLRQSSPSDDGVIGSLNISLTTQDITMRYPELLPGGEHHVKMVGHKLTYFDRICIVFDKYKYDGEHKDYPIGCDVNEWGMGAIIKADGSGLSAYQPGDAASAEFTSFFSNSGVA